MAQAAYAYELSPQRRVYEVVSPPLRALPGRKQGVIIKSLPRQLARTALITSAFCFIAVVAVGLTSISVSNATIQMLVNAESVSESILEARSIGLELEVQHSIATNPIRIQEAAVGLGMGPALSTATLEASSALSSTARYAITLASASSDDDAEAPESEASHGVSSILESPGLAAHGYAPLGSTAASSADTG